MAGEPAPGPEVGVARDRRGACKEIAHEAGAAGGGCEHSGDEQKQGDAILAENRAELTDQFNGTRNGTRRRTGTRGRAGQLKITGLIDVNGLLDANDTRRWRGRGSRSRAGPGHLAQRAARKVPGPGISFLRCHLRWSRVRGVPCRA